MSNQLYNVKYDNIMFPARVKPRLLEIEKKYKNQITSHLHRLLNNF